MPSSVIAYMNYNAHTAILRVIFVPGSIYDYIAVPREIYEEMKRSGSKGIYLNRIIKTRFEYRKVK